ncbi:MAG TPA: sugar transporter [Hyphomonas atlantica]|uniref:Sugar transporter n=1 Tax=Hyphomonas atlantica TaxID=1280948 RepID=A0A356W698_9PROT|nr:sugar transporter [Hyphomonas atlantica]
MTFTAAPTPVVRKPGFLTRIAYGVGGAASGVKNNGFEYFLLLYYSQVLGISASLVAGALFLALVVDAVSDPIVGYWSDNVRTRFGRRHPFMYAAMLPLGVAYFLTWNPPEGLDSQGLFVWLVAITITVRLCFTFYEVPSLALAAELTQDYDARTSLMSFRYFFAWIGGLAIQVALLTLLLRPTETVKMGFFNLDGWHTYGFWAAVTIVGAIFICSVGTHRYIPHLKAAPPARNLTIGKVFSEIFETVSNPSFRALFLATLFGLFASGISAALNQYINGFFWGFDTDQIAGLTMGVFLSAGMALVLAPLIGKSLGKKRGAIIIGLFAFTIAPAPVLARLFGLMPANGTDALYYIVLVITVVDVALIIVTQMLMAAMVADIVEESELATGRRSEGIFFAGISFIRKLSQGAGILTAAVVLSVAELRPGMQPGEVADASLNRLGWGYAVSLLVIWTLMIFCLSFYRISRESHAANLAALAARDEPGTTP